MTHARGNGAAKTISSRCLLRGKSSKLVGKLYPAFTSILPTATSSTRTSLWQKFRRLLSHASKDGVHRFAHRAPATRGKRHYWLQLSREVLFKCGDYSSGIIPTSFQNFKAAQCVIPLVLNHPETPISVMSGYNSKGINTMMVFDAQGLNQTEATKGYESMVIVQVTSQLRCASGRSIAISH